MIAVRSKGSGLPAKPSTDRSTAMSTVGSDAMTTARCVCARRSVMRTVNAPWTTCALVTKSPRVSKSHPVPSASSLRRSASTVTTRLSATRPTSASGDGVASAAVVAGSGIAFRRPASMAVTCSVTSNAVSPTAITPTTMPPDLSNAARRNIGARSGCTTWHCAPPLGRRRRGAFLQGVSTGSSTPDCASRANARARCDTRSFAASLASPKVTPRSRDRNEGSYPNP